MQRPKQQALVFLLGALLVGGVVGFSADRAFRRDEDTVEARRKAMYDDLALQPAQRATMDSMFDARNCQLEAVYAPIQPTVDSIKAATRIQMNVILTAEQRTRLEVRRREMDQKHAAERARIMAACRT